jgi:hypothetical protein
MNIAKNYIEAYTNTLSVILTEDSEGSTFSMNDC